ncbi:MAG: sigma-70 family RNA polymerase sigma factor [Gammaproteobacteria bacterium]|nr:sigma-70 family RNA polymerase sigma factor [Gammaproteobacteria bacterium]
MLSPPGVSPAHCKKAAQKAVLSHMQSREVRFQALLMSVMADVYRYAFWLCRDPHHAEELVQETYLRAWRSLDSLKDDKAAKTWLITILRREHARCFERNRPDISDVDPEVLAGHGGYDTSTEAFNLRRALAALPEEYAEPLLMQVIGGYTAEEIARLLELTPSAVNTRLFRARHKLREVLDGPDRDMPATVQADHELS